MLDNLMTGLALMASAESFIAIFILSLIHI